MEEKLKALSSWLAVNPNGAVKIAAVCGYKSPVTVLLWLRRKSIPDWSWKSVEKIISRSKQQPN